MNQQSKEEGKKLKRDKKHTNHNMGNNLLTNKVRASIMEPEGESITMRFLGRLIVSLGVFIRNALKEKLTVIEK